MKQCSKCKKLLETNLSNFHKDKYQKDGFTNECKNCRLQSKKKYYMDNKDLILSKAKNYYYNNISKLQKQSLDYYYKNIDSCIERNKLWCTNNPEERKEHKHRSNSKRRAVLNNCYAEHITQEEMSLILDQYQTCPYCNISLHKKNTQLDHVYPLSKGGQHTIFNLMPCCADCNNIKQNKLPIYWFLK